MVTRIAGVTFNNEAEDGGVNRQKILNALANSGRQIITVDLKRTQYNGELAIKCIEHTTRQVIGWIPKSDIDKITHSQMTGFIDYGKHGYSVRLDWQHAPTAKQYHYVKSLCTKHGIELPAYDIRAYAYVFALERA